MSAKNHLLADGLSRWPKSLDDPDDLDDNEDWIDAAYSFSMGCLNKNLVMNSSKYEDTEPKSTYQIQEDLESKGSFQILEPSTLSGPLQMQGPQSNPTVNKDILKIP